MKNEIAHVLPQSVLRRNMQSILRAFDRGDYNKVIITKNRVPVAYLLSKQHYDELVNISSTTLK